MVPVRYSTQWTLGVCPDAWSVQGRSWRRNGGDADDSAN
ncbi:hypothetical protein [Azospirillum endophyticum]